MKFSLVPKNVVHEWRLFPKSSPSKKLRKRKQKQGEREKQRKILIK